jgi:hypothetical protein
MDIKKEITDIIYRACASPDHGAEAQEVWAEMIMDIFRKVIADQKVYCGKCSGELEAAEVTEDSSGNLRENLKCEKCGAASVYFIIGKDQEDDLAAFSGR